MLGGRGHDRVMGGGGDDRLSARNGMVDRVLCGSGTDGVVADEDDRVAADCEELNRR